MEVNFRPISPSAAARRASPGQIPSSDEAQNFLELIESLTSAESNPETGNQAGKKNEGGTPGRQPESLEPVDEQPEGTPADIERLSEEQQCAEEKTVGARFDILA